MEKGMKIMDMTTCTEHKVTKENSASARSDYAPKGTSRKRGCNSTSGISTRWFSSHLAGYLVHQPSFKVTYRKDSVGGLYGHTDSDWGNSLSRLSTTGLIA